MNDKDLLSIKKFSELTGIPQSKLRYYDEVKLFQPIERGENDYRYYSAMQTIAVIVVNVMRSANIPLKKISELKKNLSPRAVLEILQENIFELNQELYRLQQAYSIIHTYCGLINEGLLADESEISCCRMPAMRIELGPLNDFSSGYLYDSFFKFLGSMEDRNIDTAYPAGAYYEDVGAFLNAPGQPTRFFSQVPTGRDIKEAGDYLVGYTRGYYGNLGDLPERMREKAAELGVTITGPVYELYLHDEISIEDKDQYLIQISIPYTKKRKR